MDDNSNTFVDGWIDDQIDEYMQIDNLIDRQMLGWMDAWVDGWIDEQIDEQIDTLILIDRQMHGWTVHVDGCMELIHRCVNENTLYI